jgi:hypothetical protein
MPKQRFRPGLAQIQLQHDLATFHYLTPAQLRRARGWRAPNRVYELLIPLREHGFVGYREPKPRASGGRVAGVYYLLPRAVRYLAACGYPVQQQRVGLRSDTFLEHILFEADILIACRELTRVVPQLHIVQMLHELDAGGPAPRVTLCSGKQVSLRHDGFVRFRCADDTYCIWYEADRNSTYQVALKAKIRRLSHYIDHNGGYWRDFATDNLTVAWLTTGGQRRLMQLRQWTRAELDAVHKPYLAGYFLFSCLDPATVPVEELFLKPTWVSAADDAALVPLLELPPGSVPQPGRTA